MPQSSRAQECTQSYPLHQHPHHLHPAPTHDNPLGWCRLGWGPWGKRTIFACSLDQHKAHYTPQSSPNSFATTKKTSSGGALHLTQCECVPLIVSNLVTGAEGGSVLESDCRNGCHFLLWQLQDLVSSCYNIKRQCLAMMANIYEIKENEPR